MESTDSGQRGAWFSSGRVDVVIEDPPAAASLGSRAWQVFIAAATLVNFLVPMAAGIWLALHGYRLEAGVGVGCAVLVPFVWTWVAFKPSGLLAAPAILAGDRAHPVVVMIASSLTTAAMRCASWASVAVAVRALNEAAMPSARTPCLRRIRFTMLLVKISCFASKCPKFRFGASITTDAHGCHD